MSGHNHSLHDTPEKRIRSALILTLGAMGISIGGGILSHSLALLSDAGHMLADAGALGLALVAQRVASRPRPPPRPYGWRRPGTLAAFVNAILLAGASLLLVLPPPDPAPAPPRLRAA